MLVGTHAVGGYGNAKQCSEAGRTLASGGRISRSVLDAYTRRLFNEDRVHVIGWKGSLRRERERCHE